MTRRLVEDHDAEPAPWDQHPDSHWSTDMITVIVQHVAEDYDAWRRVFDEHGSTRTAHGCTSERVYRAVDDPNAVAVMMEWPSKEAAEGFMADPTLAEAMSRGGITEPPTITFGDRVPVPSS